MSSPTPSASASGAPGSPTGQPFSSASTSPGVLGQSSSASTTPSPSASNCALAQPFSSTSAPAGVFGQSSWPSTTPSSSASSPVETGHPLASTSTFAGVFGQSSSASITPSLSASPEPGGGSVAGGQPVIRTRLHSNPAAVNSTPDRNQERICTSCSPIFSICVPRPPTAGTLKIGSPNCPHRQSVRHVNWSLALPTTQGK
jgi:hypothetical protein